MHYEAEEPQVENLQRTKAWNAVMDCDAETLRNLCRTEGLDINDIYKGIKKKSKSRLTPPLILFLSSRAESEFDFEFDEISKENFCKEKLPAFLKELHKMGCDFKMKYPNETGLNAADLVLGSETTFTCKQKEYMLRLLSKYGVKPSRYISMSFYKIMIKRGRYIKPPQSNSGYYDAANEGNIDFFGQVSSVDLEEIFYNYFMLERAAGCDFYGNNKDPKWVEDGLALNDKTDIPVYDETTGRITFITKEHTDEEIRAIFDSYAAAGTVPTLDFFHRLFAALFAPGESQKKTLYFEILCKILASAKFTEATKNTFRCIHDEIISGCVDEGISRYSSKGENTEKVYKLNILLNSLNPHLLLERWKQHDFPSLSHLNSAGTMTPIFCGPSTIAAICEILRKIGVGPGVVFRHLAEDIFHDSIWHLSSYVTEVRESLMSGISEKLAILTSYNWDINDINNAFTVMNGYLTMNRTRPRINLIDSFADLLDKKDDDDDGRPTQAKTLLKILCEKGLDFSIPPEKQYSVSDLMLKPDGEVKDGCKELYRFLVKNGRGEPVPDETQEIEISW